MNMRRSDFRTLTEKGRQKRRKKQKSLGDKEYASLEKNIYGVPRIISDTPKAFFDKLKKSSPGQIKYTETEYLKDCTIKPPMPIPPKD